MLTLISRTFLPQQRVLALLLALVASPTAAALPCWFYQPSPEGAPGAIGISRTISFEHEPLQIAQLRAATRLLSSLPDQHDQLNPQQQADILAGKRAIGAGKHTIHLLGEFTHEGYIYAYASLKQGINTKKRCPQYAKARPQACDPAWLCSPVQAEAVGFTGVSGRASSPEQQFRYAIENALRLLEYTYGVRIQGEERFLDTNSGLGSLHLRSSDFSLSRQGSLPPELRLYVRELRLDGTNLYVWLVSPDLAPYPVPQDLSWRTEPSQGDFLGEVGVARRTWDGRLSTQIDLAVQNALFGLAKIRGVDIKTVEVLKAARAGTSSGRATLVRVQNELSAQLLGLHIEPDGPVHAWMGWRLSQTE